MLSIRGIDRETEKRAEQAGEDSDVTRIPASTITNYIQHYKEFFTPLEIANSDPNKTLYSDEAVDLVLDIRRLNPKQREKTEIVAELSKKYTSDQPIIEDENESVQQQLVQSPTTSVQQEINPLAPVNAQQAFSSLATLLNDKILFIGILSKELELLKKRVTDQLKFIDDLRLQYTEQMDITKKKHEEVLKSLRSEHRQVIEDSENQQKDRVGKLEKLIESKNEQIKNLESELESLQKKLDDERQKYGFWGTWKKK